MQILNINIIEYGSIKNRSIDFSNGLNIIEGENESGKSTILSFIKFVLYGLPRRASGEVVSEKERSFSWDGGIASGSITIRSEKGEYRIERNAREGVRGDKVSIVDIADGTPQYKGEIPGELFLGVPASVFESTAFVKQLGCSSINGEEIGGALQNLLLSADETLDSEKAVTKIESIRRKLLHKSKQGGSIYELSLKKDEYSTRLEASKEKAIKIQEYEDSFENLDKLCAESRKKLEENRKLCEAYDRRQLLIRFESLRSAKARIESIEGDIAALKAEKCYLGFVPDSIYQRRLALAERDFSASCEELEEKKKEYEKAKESIPAESEKIAIAHLIEEEGGADKVADRIINAEKKATKSKTAGIMTLIPTVVCAVFLAFATGALLCRFALLPANLPQVMSFLENILMAPVFGAATIVFLVLTIVFFKKASKNRKKAKALRAKFSILQNAEQTQLRPLLDSCVKAGDARREMIKNAERLKNEVGISAEKNEKYVTELKEQLGQVGETIEEKDTKEAIKERVSEILTRSASLCEEIEELQRDLSKYSALMEEREKEVAELDENRIRASLSPDTLEKLSEVNITMLRREYEFLRAKTEKAEQKKYFYDRELIGLRASAENPLKNEALLRKTEERLAVETDLHDALTLAAESIKEAAESMRKNVTPRLRARAGEYMRVLTSGKYSELGITPEFNITVNAGGVTRPIEALSAGTRDAAYLSVRLALIAVLYRGENPPLLFDEVLSQIDDGRAAAILNMLGEYCDGGEQCLLFSCHTRESSMAKSKANIIKL